MGVWTFVCVRTGCMLNVSAVDISICLYLIFITILCFISLFEIILCMMRTIFGSASGETEDHLRGC